MPKPLAMATLLPSSDDDLETASHAKLLPDRLQFSSAAPASKFSPRRRLVLLGFFCLCLVALLFVACRVSISPAPSSAAFSVRESDLLTILVVGDWGRKGRYNQSAVAEQMGVVGAELSPEFIVSVGDNFYENGLTGSNDTAFSESFSQIYTADSLQKTWHAILGNHDYRGDVLAQLDPVLKTKDSRWSCQRSFSLSRELSSSGGSSSVDLFFYDTNPFVEKYWLDTEQAYDWRGVEPKDEYLSKQKEFLSTGLGSSNATWKIVLGHHPVRSVGEHGNTVELVEQIFPILKENNVDLYINGHDHCLEHIEESGVLFLTTGGGSKAYRGMNSNADKSGLQFYYDGQGFMSLSITATQLNFTFYDVLGKILHAGSLSKASA